MAQPIIAPNPYQQEQEQLRRKRQLIDAATQMAMTPRAGQMAGQVYVGGSNAGTALTQILGGFLGAKAQKDLDQQEKGISEQYKRDLETAVNQYMTNPGTREGAVGALASPFPQMQALGAADLEKLRSQDTPLMRMLGGMQSFGQPGQAPVPQGQMAPGAAPMAPMPQGQPLDQPAPASAPAAGGPQVPGMAEQLFPFLQKPEILTLLMADPSGKLAAQANAERGKVMKLGPEDQLFQPVGVGQFAPSVGTQSAQVAHAGNIARAREGAKAMFDLAPPIETPQGTVYPSRAQVLQAGQGPQTLGPAQGRTYTPEEFIQQYRPVIDQIAKETGVAPEIVAGQLGLETGWGSKVIPGTNNLGNIKDFGGQGPKARDNATGSVDSYRSYGNPQAFAQDFTQLIKNRYPNAVGAGGDVARFGQGIKGYAEDPKYANKLAGATETARRAMGTGQPSASVSGSPVAGATVPYNSALKATDQKSRESDLKFVESAREQAAKAGESLGAVEAIRGAVKGGNFAGAFGTVQERAAAFADALGLPVDKNKLTNTQYLQSELKRLALPQVKALGFNPTDTDRQFIEQAIGQIATDPAAFDKILQRMEQIAQRDIKKFDAMDSYFRENNSLKGFNYNFKPEKQEPQGNLPTPQQLGLPPGFKVLRRID